MELIFRLSLPHGLDGHILQWVKNQLDGQAQRVVLNGV